MLNKIKESKFWPHSLQARMTLLLTAFFIINLILMISTNAYGIWRTEQKSWQQGQTDAALRAADILGRYIGHTFEVMQVSNEVTDHPELEEHWLNYLFEHNPEILELVIADPTGKIILSHHQDESLLASSFTITQSYWFRTALNGETYITDLFISPKQEPYAIFSLPDANGNICAARIDMELMWEVVKNIRFGQTGTALIVDPEGTILAHTNPTIPLNYKSIPAGIAGLDAIIEAGSGTWSGVYLNLEGQRVVAAAAPIPGTEWTVVTEQDFREAYASTRFAFIFMIATTLASTTISLALIMLLIKQVIIKPLETLRTGVEQIANGGLDYSPLVPSNDEFGVVAKEFNLMTKKLRAREAELTERTTELAISEERYALASQATNDGLWDLDLITNKLFFSARWKSMLGYSEDELGDQLDDWYVRVHPDDRNYLEIQFDKHLKGYTPVFQAEYRMQNKAGEYRWMVVRGLVARDANGQPYRLAGSQSDITKRKQFEQQLIHDAFHDSLTGLANRSLLTDRIQRAILRKNRNDDYNFGIIFMDLDRFKIINDSLGHRVGDKLLIEVGKRLLNTMRASDTLARLGGDEFVFLIEDIESPHCSARFAERVIEAISYPFELEEEEIQVNCSLGVVLSDSAYQSSDDYLRDADIAMYQAKESGKGCYEIFTPSMKSAAFTRLTIEADLRRALQNNEFFLEYQPIVSITTKKPVGFEALIRWNHPDSGIVPPYNFIPVAEESGLIIPIGFWVMNEASKQLIEWQQAKLFDSEIKISVNVSGKQLSQPGFIEQVKHILAKNKIDGRCLNFEITENSIINDIKSATLILNQLKELNISIHLDDFGTGYSSLNYLHSLPIDVIKIDRSFVNKIGTEDKNPGIVRMIISLAKELGLAVTAEGIETAEQMQLLNGLQCDYGQGFYISRPQPKAIVENMYTKSKVSEG